MKKSLLLFLLVALVSVSMISAASAATVQETPISKDTAILIAKLQDGLSGVAFNEIDLIQLHKIGEHVFWFLNVRDKDTNEKWTVTVDASTGMSRKDREDGSVEGSTNWRSFNELKAIYISQLYCPAGIFTFKKPKEVQPNIWEVPIIQSFNDEPDEHFSIYFNSKTGYSCFGDEKNPNDWISLKELDDLENKEHDYGDHPFRNALRDLYPE